MAQINIKITQEQKEEIANIAKQKNLSVTQLVIDSIQFYNDSIQKVEEDSTIIDDKNGIENDSQKVENGKERIEIEVYKEMTETLKEQLKQKDIQIDQLHKIVYNKDTLLIETSIEKKHWWQFWKSSDKE